MRAVTEKFSFIIGKWLEYRLNRQAVSPAQTCVLLNGHTHNTVQEGMKNCQVIYVHDSLPWWIAGSSQAATTSCLSLGITQNAQQQHIVLGTLGFRVTWVSLKQAFRECLCLLLQTRSVLHSASGLCLQLSPVAQ